MYFGRPDGALRRISTRVLGASLFAMLALSSAPVAAATRAYAPDTMQVLSGSVSEQGVGVLGERSLTGRSDGWDDYVEFSTDGNGFVADFTFELPLDLLDAQLDGLTVRTNYKGSAGRFQRWDWSIRDTTTGGWQAVGDNRGVPDWQWTMQRFDVPGNAADHVDALGRVTLRLRSPRAGDDADLDYLALQVRTSAIAPPVQADVPVATVATSVATPVATNTATSASSPSSPAVAPTPTPIAVQAAPASVTAPVASSSDDGIWRPAPGTSWQIQYTGTIDTSLDVDMYNLDLFDTSRDRIAALQAEGRKVICYFSAGTRENWRADASQFPSRTLGASNADWPGEQWLDVRAIDALAPIMNARLDLAAAKGCDGVDPDNVDGYQNATGLPIAFGDQIAYNRYLADAAHARGLSIGLKNDLGQVRELEPYFDFATNESCNVYDECELLSPFVSAGKAVFGIEYRDEPASFCSRTNALDFDFLKKQRLLDAERSACR